MSWQIGRRVRAQAPFLLVLAIVAAAFLYMTIAPNHWRRGTATVATAMLIAAVFRSVLSGQRAGLLSVRGRWCDVLCYLAVGLLIILVDIRLH